jgi:hypothetical protein
MIECIFTIDYEMHGNGEGSLKDLVYEPTERLRAIFRKWNYRFVAFVEVAELEMIDAKGTDPYIDSVRQQVRNLHGERFELGLHLHPQWYNGQYKNGGWLLDYSEYNLCTLPRERIVQIVDRSICYFRKILGVLDFTPLSFRGGNWLFQPTKTAAGLLAEWEIKVDSSVFKGGLQHQHKLDYRRALRNGYYWKFMDDVNLPDPKGTLLELPIYAQMVLPWRMLTNKRIALQQRGSREGHNGKQDLNRFMNFFRFRYPLKLDFCRMTLKELIRMVDAVIDEDQQDPTSFRPVVAIGHTKDLVDFETVEKFLSYLEQKGITISTFKEVYTKCTCD